MAATPPAPWGTCTTCGDAVPPGATVCPICGKPRTAENSDTAPSPKSLRRLRIHKTWRTLLVVGVAVGLGGVMALALYQGPQVAPDPLTRTWVLQLTPGTFQSFSGAVTGGDYITGNFTIVDPPGALTTFVVYNETSFDAFAHGKVASPAQPPLNETSGIVDFSALVTDNYYFVFEDHYPATSGITETVYCTTQYLSNVVVE